MIYFTFGVLQKVMKAAHGSPPLTRSNRHQSNSSYNHRTKTCSGSKAPSGKMMMPPILRLDSTGETTSYDRPVQSMGYQRTNTCRQGASLGAASGKNSLFGKLISHIAPQPSTSSDFLDQSRIKNGLFVLDELLNSKQTFDSAAMAGKPSHVKMAQNKFTHSDRYGQWGTMCPSYPILPRGVFPCHVFNALQSHRDPLTMWGASSGHFVFSCGVPSFENPVAEKEKSAPLVSSLLDACSKCSTESSNSPPPKMFKSVFHSSLNSECNGDTKYRGNVSVQNQTCGSPVDTACGSSTANEAAHSDAQINTVIETQNDPQCCAMKNGEEQQEQVSLNPPRCTNISNTNSCSVENVHSVVENQSECELIQDGVHVDGILERDESNFDTVSTEVVDETVIGENEFYPGFSETDYQELMQFLNESCLDPQESEKAQKSPDKVDVGIQVETEHYIEPGCEGAECMEILMEKNFYRPVVECDCPRTHRFCIQWTRIWRRPERKKEQVLENTRVDVQKNNEDRKTDKQEDQQDTENTQASNDRDKEGIWDTDDNEDHANSETAQGGNANEHEEIWECFLGNDFSLTNLMSTSNKQTSQKEVDPDEPDEERRVPKHCPAATKRWCQAYSSVPSTAERVCKVQFECGEGKDIVYEYERGEDETLTVMEIQKARDLTRQHQGNAAKLLQKTCADGDLGEESLETDGDDGVDGSATEDVEELDADTILVLVLEDSDSDDSDCEEDSSGSEDEEDGDDSDDEFIVFE
ncbi:uncharacterized protein LOC143286702 [Babylonia areolata]|uniref:uncharacterized protein LOC143286702 n=1 Tax=Babylonia areolata TaxID=304850 RepID=UPI003FD43A0B